MMRPTWKVLLLLLTLALAAPATVVAQSAGDDQYVDPFEGQGDGNGGGGGNNGSQNDGSDNGTTTTAQTAPSDTAGTTTESTDSGATLPRTGFTLLPVALAGMFLFGTGAGLRRGTRLPTPVATGSAAPTSPPGVIRETGSATPPRAGVSVIGIGVVGLLLLSTLLRRRA